MKTCNFESLTGGRNRFFCFVGAWLDQPWHRFPACPANQSKSHVHNFLLLPVTVRPVSLFIRWPWKITAWSCSAHGCHILHQGHRTVGHVNTSTWNGRRWWMKGRINSVRIDEEVFGWIWIIWMNERPKVYGNFSVAMITRAILNLVLKQEN